MGQPLYLEKMTSVQGRVCLSQKSRTSDKVVTSPSSHRSNNKDHKDPLRSNKPPAEPPKALLLEIDTVCYTKKDL